MSDPLTQVLVLPLSPRSQIYERAPVVVTAEDDKRIRVRPSSPLGPAFVDLRRPSLTRLSRSQRATDKRILILLMVVYWLQVLDKTALGYTAACVSSSLSSSRRSRA